jgi:uncharacterized protein
MKFLAIIFIMLAAGCVETTTSTVTVSGQTYNVEIADSPEERATGLMNREFLGEAEGMLFIFPDEQKRSFWMKNTLIPLDLAFISSDFVVVDMVTLEPCVDVCNSYTSKEKATYVLEVNKDSGIAVGDTISLK